MARFAAFAPVLQLLYLAAIGAMSLACGALYMGCPVDPILLATFAGLVFGIYGLNRFTDHEDIINKPENRLFFQDNSLMFAGTVGIFAASLAALWMTGRLTSYHIVLTVFGIVYSVKVVPMPGIGGKITFSRLKDIPFAKSLVVALLLGTAFFAVNWSVYPSFVSAPLQLTLLIATCIITVFINTNFADLRDIEGDRVMQVPTIPVLFGERGTIIGTMIVPGLLLLGTTLFLAFSGRVSLGIAVFVGLNLLYPLLYVSAWFRGGAIKKIVEPLADACVLVYAAGLLGLRFFA